MNIFPTWLNAFKPPWHKQQNFVKTVSVFELIFKTFSMSINFRDTLSFSSNTVDWLTENEQLWAKRQTIRLLMRFYQWRIYGLWYQRQEVILKAPSNSKNFRFSLAISKYFCIHNAPNSMVPTASFRSVLRHWFLRHPIILLFLNGNPRYLEIFDKQLNALEINAISMSTLNRRYSRCSLKHIKHDT